MQNLKRRKFEVNFILDNLSVVIPTKDDHIRIKENLDSIIQFLNENIKKYEIIIVSNGSTADSVDFINKQIYNFDSISHKTIQTAGKGLAIRTGIKHSKFNNVLFTDADSSVDINEFKKFVSAGKLISGFVIGNRKNIKSENINSPIIRNLSGTLYLKLINFVFKVEIEDSQCGFKAVDKNIFSNCVEFQTDGFSFDIELIMLAIKSNIEILEIPVKYVHNKESKVNILSDTFKMLKDLYKINKIIN